MENNRMRVEHGNTFHQSISNVGKLGFYPTEPSHCKKISTMLRWPEKDVNILEPSIGNGVALKCVCSQANKEKVHTFGVELNVEIFNSLNEEKDEMGVDYLLNADFLHGVKISNKFHFCFANPPYGDGEDGIRLEQLFVEKIFGYLKARGLFCLVVPYYLFQNEKFVKSFFGRFEPLGVYRFDDSEYAKYKQVVIFSRRRPCTGFLRDTLMNWIAPLSRIENIPYLRDSNDVFDVPGGAESVDVFTTKKFDAEAFRKALLTSTLVQGGKHGCIEPYSSTAAGSPPIPLTNETSYLVAVCGVGSGVAGNEEEGTLHLQRGNVETVEVEKHIADSDIVDVTLTSVTTMNIIDSEFNYMQLKGNAVVEDEEESNEDDE